MLEVIQAGMFIVLESTGETRDTVNHVELEEALQE